MKKIYIHYGSSKFNIEKFDKITNEKDYPKPSGGLWASPINADMSWKSFVEENPDIPIPGENPLAEYFEFTILDNSKIYHLYNENDVHILPKQDTVVRSTPIVDFEKMIQLGYDGIELHLSEDTSENQGFGRGLYYNMWTWDCDCILIFNPNIIQPI